MTMGLYHYEPSQALAIGAASLFGLGACIHIIQMLRYKTWFFTAFVVGAFSMDHIILAETTTDTDINTSSDDIGLCNTLPLCPQHR